MSLIKQILVAIILIFGCVSIGTQGVEARQSHSSAENLDAKKNKTGKKAKSASKSHAPKAELTPPKKGGLFSSFTSGLKKMGSKVANGAKKAGSKVAAGAKVAGSKVAAGATALKNKSGDAVACRAGKGEVPGAKLYAMAASGTQLVDKHIVVAHTATLENLGKCATEKNPAYMEGILKGAMNAFDKDAKAAAKAGKPANFKKAANTLLKVIKFLFSQSSHFSPIYKHEAHKPVFDKDLDHLIQSLFHAEYALAKSKSAQKEVIKDYTAIVAELKKDGVSNLAPIATPSAKAANGILAKMKAGVKKASSAIAGGAKKAAAKAKKAAAKAKKVAGKAAEGAKNLAHKAKDKISPKSTEDAPADDSGDNPAPSDDSGDAPADDSSDAPAADSSDAPADDSGDAPAPSDDESVGDGSNSDGEEPAADSSDAPSDDSGDAPADDSSDAPADDSKDAPADDSGDAPADDSSDAPADDSGDAPADDSGDASADDSGDASSDDSGDSSSNNESVGDGSDSDAEEPAEEDLVSNAKGAASEALKKGLSNLLGD